MEKTFDITDFEASLKEHADDFTMMPSKRVWNGVYNRLHPGSKWPSITMGLLFMLALVGIGPMNNSTKNYNMDSQNPENTESINFGTGRDANKSRQPATQNTLPENSTVEKSGKTIGKIVPISSAMAGRTKVGDDSEAGNPLSAGTESATAPSWGDVRKITAPKNVSKPGVRISDEGSTLEKSVSKPLPVSTNVSGKMPENIPFAVAAFELSTEDLELLQILPSPTSDLTLPNDSSEISEAVTPPPVKKKRNKKVSWFYYIAPTVSSVYFTGKPMENHEPLSGLPSVIIYPDQVGNTMRVNARIGYKAGAEVKFTIAENWKLLTGAQLSYSGYNILSNKVHPSFAFLILQDEEGKAMPKKYMTFYGNGQGEDHVTLHNKSLQFSLPVGMEYSVWKKGTVEISVASTIEPIFVVKADAFILSSDGRNYISDPDLMRKSNVSGQLGTFISFNSSKLKWQIGPSVRYQLLSSYKNEYPVSEHLLDYGIRIGISRPGN